MEGSFQFNFFGGGSEEASAAGSAAVAAVAPASAAGDGEAEEVGPHEAQQAAAPPSEVQLEGGIVLLKGAVSSQAAAEMLGQPELQASDLVPAKYEGGFKLWEGAVDLCEHLAREHHLSPGLLLEPSPETGLRGKRVLELGCGHGLPGILCLLAGAAVHFQDFNRQVITSLTLPNVAANLARLPEGAYRQGCRYFAGDWRAVGGLLSRSGLGGNYDLVLTAETIYNQDSQERLLGCIKQVLQPPHGVALVAAKSFYFGVGGSTASFAELVKADGVLECRQVWKVEDGCSNKREILKLSFPESITPYFL